MEKITFHTIGYKQNYNKNYTTEKANKILKQQAKL